MEKSVFETLESINVNDKTEKKGKFTYLSWAFAWGELKKRYPDATYKVYENENGWCYHTDGATAWVKVGVTVDGQELIEYYPIMDNRNNAIPLEQINSREVNDSLQRGLVKAIARHGLGLYIYAGEDIPTSEKEEGKKEAEAKAKKEADAKAKAIAKKKKEALEVLNSCSDAKAVIELYKHNSLDEFSDKELDNLVQHKDQILEKYGKAEAEATEAEATEPEAPKPKTKKPVKLPNNVEEASIVPCSLTGKDVAGKTIGQLFGEGRISQLDFIANSYKGNDEAMREAARIILAEAEKSA